MKEKIHFGLGAVALLGAYFFAPHSMILKELLPIDGMAIRAIGFFSLSTMVLATARIWAPERFFLHLLWATSFIGCIYLFGVMGGVIVFSLPMLWLLLMHFIPGVFAKLICAAIALAGLMAMRKGGFFSLSFWWIACQWLRCLAVAFEWKRSAWKGELIDLSSLRAVSLHFCAPPFLLSPIPMEWISFSYFREKIEGPRIEQAFRKGAILLWTGIGFLLLYELCRRYVEPFRSEAWNVQRLSELNGEGWFHLKAGWTFLLLRLWQYCALTAFVAGAWHLLGSEIRYDFYRPLLSRNGFMFWQRYHNYGREFLMKHIFFPVAFHLSRRLHWSASSALAGALVLAMIVVVQATSMVPIAGVPFSQTYSWVGSLQHTLWSAAFVLITHGFSYISNRCIPWPRCREGAEIFFTFVLLGWLFYNSFAQLWASFTNAEFLRAIWSW